MGKKKSKIAKKIQATKKFGGLLVQKGGAKHHSDPSTSSSTPNVIAIASASKSKTAVTATKHKHKLQRQFVKPTSSTSNPSIGRTIVNSIKDNNKKKKNNQDDFESQMKSLQERTAHLESNTRRGRSSRTTTSTKNKTIIQLAPASFIIDDKLKSTDRLVQEATHKMELGWSSWDNNVSSAPQPHQHQFASANTGATTSSHTLQELAKHQHHRVAWTDESPLESTGDNPYAALQQDDDDDDHDHNNGRPGQEKPQKLNPLFQFAPPSFQFQSENDNSGDWDPDL